MVFKFRHVAAIGFMLMALQTWADVRLPKIFGSHMVLQRRKPLPVWGWSEPNEKITVQFNNQTKSTKADQSGKWLLRLDPVEAGGPFALTVTGKKNTVTFDDVLVGEVWVCSGQSNMEMVVKSSANAEKEIKEGNYPLIRHFKVPHDMSLTPKEDVLTGSWQACTPETVGNFTAVGYFFARELQKELNNVPIGLLNSSWGGTQSESWTSREAMASFDEFKPALDAMPKNLDEFARQRLEQLQAQITKLQGSLPAAAEVQQWSGMDFNDANWPTLRLPDLFDRKAIPGFDGVVWFRREVTIPNELAGKEMTLSLGTIDDADETYVNGIKVGNTGQAGLLRNYTIPAGTLKPGRNVIAVRDEDYGGGGGFTAKEDQFKLSGSGREISVVGDWKFRIADFSRNAVLVNPNMTGTILYNAMINPLIPYAIEGVIWYQGETNAGRAFQYRKAFPLMITDWRTRWGQGDFPFLFVQLASFNAGNGNSANGSNWAELREAQTMTLALPNTGMAVTSDIGEAKDIHPKNKQDVGKRLAINALKTVYGQNREYSGPVFKSMEVNGNKAILTFDHLGAGLMSSDKYGYLKGFEVAGADQKFYWAKAEIQGDKVVVYANEVATPVSVHYGWADDNGEVNLYNKEGLPAVPFRTDTWPGKTETARFK
ncbi:sialate O-acetylesterase [Larkinella knui]|uniref:Sialate O-acetylesterase n=1 Tax=Larkinella knui TaxID=2025310 RepID=A0A3P1CLI0_9BACT|nr:sialate O-acetylesterase [Larkinella knui]RRB14155.1 sialate O-acetylesterase [Larkinella knui]